MMLNSVYEELRFDDNHTAEIGAMAYSPHQVHAPGAAHLQQFYLENGLPVWRYAIYGHEIEKRISLPFAQNTVFVSYRLLSGNGPVRIRIRPFMHFRLQREEILDDLKAPYAVQALGNRYEVRGDNRFPILRLFLYGHQSHFNLSGGEFKEIFLQMEVQRGYQAWETVWSPGFFRVVIDRNEDAALAASATA